MKLRGILLTSTVAILASAGTARAADPIIYEPVPEGFTWTGAYIGLQGGYGWAELSTDDGDDVFFFLSEGDSIDLEGGFLGIYGGYNYQFDNNVVLGIEADINKAWMDESFFFEGNTEVALDWFASVRGRIGYAWDRTLLFATGGIAFAQVDYELDLFDFSDDENFTGWTLGVGGEHAFTDNLLARAEYRYYDFGSGEFTVPQLGTDNLDLDMHTISVGLAYKF